MSRTETTWSDAFPWLPAGDHETDAWHHTPLHLGDPREYRARLRSVAETAIERRTDWAVDQLFVWLPLDTELSGLPFTPRGRNVLLRNGYVHVEDLQDLTVRDMLDWRQVGAETLTEILMVLAGSTALAALVPRGDTPRRAQPSTSHRSAQPTTGISHDSPIVNDLRVVATWLVSTGHHGSSLLAQSMTTHTPIAVGDAYERLMALRPADVLKSDELELNVAVQLSQALEALDARDVGILARRFFADDPDTLDVIGRDLGITRERVRQLEAKSRAKLVELIQPGGALEMVASAARQAVDTLLPLRDLLVQIPALEQKVDAVSQPAWRVIDRIDDAYEIEDGWCAAPSAVGVKELISARLDELSDAYGIVELEAIGTINESLPREQDRNILADWLKFCGYTIRDNYVLTRNKSIPDRVCASLYLYGSPMSTAEIIEYFNGERTASSIRNAIASDERIVRIDRDKWALSEWGEDAYEGIRAAIRKELSAHGGKISLDQLQRNLTQRYSISAASVMTYANIPPFELREGMVTLWSGQIATRKTPQKTRRLFRFQDGWQLRVEVTQDHLRGSGFVAPSSLAGLLQLRVGDTLELDSRLGPQKVYWTGTQPSIGSVRRFLLEFNADVGDHIFLQFTDSGSFDVVGCTALSGDPLDDALHLAGLDTALPDAKARLASAIGIDVYISTPSLVEEFRARGDSDIADLLVQARAALDQEERNDTSTPSVAIDDILDLL